MARAGERRKARGILNNFNCTVLTITLCTKKRTFVQFLIEKTTNMTPRHFLFLFLLTLPLCISAQKRKSATPPKSIAEQAQEAIDRYQFNQAEKLLTKEITTLKKRHKETSKLERMLRSARTGANKLHATERLVIIDSVVCPKQEVLRAIRLSQESGRIDTYASTYHAEDIQGATIYENELANKRFLSIEIAEEETDGDATKLRLATSDKIGEEWSKPNPLSGLNEDDLAQNYPFLMSDGLTLYYAATGPESIGGYDIFVTRADGEGGNFLSPENVGFPFNSPANDYLLAIDELNQLGWFVSDRRQPQGMACIYVFIPNDTREVYADISDDQLQRLARIASIQETWNDEVEAAQQRLAAVRSGQGKKAQKPEFTFPVDNQRVYHHTADFSSPIARFKIGQWVKLSQTISTDETLLERLREKYAKAKPADRKQMTSTLQKLEKTLQSQEAELNQLAKDIRNAEITHKQ